MNRHSCTARFSLQYLSTEKEIRMTDKPKDQIPDEPDPNDEDQNNQGSNEQNPNEEVPKEPDPNELTDMTELANRSSHDEEAKDRLLRFLFEKLTEQIKYNRPISHTFTNDDWMSIVTIRLITTLSQEKKWENRRRLWKYVYLAKESVLIDYLRSRNTEKRGGGRRPVSLDSSSFSSLNFPKHLPKNLEQAEKLKAAMECLLEQNKDLYDLICDKYYGAMSLVELSEVHGISEYLVKQKLEEAYDLLKECYGED